MIIFFGPAGSGKSVQGQLLGEQGNWQWVSVGKLLRDADLSRYQDTMNRGDLLPEEVVNGVVQEKIESTGDISQLVLDGFPRNNLQAQWFVDYINSKKFKIDVALVLEVPTEEVYERLSKRGRPDDIPETIARRMDLYRKETEPMLELFQNQGVVVVRINGVGTVEEVHERIINALKAEGLA